MSRSLWVIAVMGFVAVMIVVVAMLISLTMFQQSPASNRARLAQEITNQFGFPAVGADVRDILGRTVLVVIYETGTDSKFDEKIQKAEMAKVAAFVEGKYDGKDRRSILEIRVRRKEIRTRGCWGRTLENSFSIENPRFPEDRPKNPPLGVPVAPNAPPPVRR